MHTKDRLARVLEAHGLKKLAARARTGEYDDYESPLTFPKMQLVKDLEANQAHGLARRVEAGEFDNTKQEADEYMQSPRGIEDVRAVKRSIQGTGESSEQD